MNKDQAQQKGTHGRQQDNQKDGQKHDGMRGEHKESQPGQKVDQKDDKGRQGAQRDQLDDQGRQRHMGHGDQKDDQSRQRQGGMDAELGRPVKAGKGDSPSQHDRQKEEAGKSRQSEPRR
jgi:hypothetical protein